VARSLSSQKRHRQNLRRAEQNKARRTLIKTNVRKVTEAIQTKDVEAAEKAFREAAKTLDRNAARQTIHRNTAARRKSRLARQLNTLKAGARK
jgi:small subunit ribosomal protein S20